MKVFHFKGVKGNERETLVNHFETALELKQKKMTANALLLIKSECVGNDILERLANDKAHYSKDNRIMGLIKDLELMAMELQIGKGLEDFITCFEQVHTSFYTVLDANYPKLSPADRRFAVLLSLNLSTKEIAILTNRQVRGIEASKYQLRKKMNVDGDVNVALSQLLSKVSLDSLEK